MQALVKRIEEEGKNLGNGILKVDGFINHQLEPKLTLAMGQHFKESFDKSGVTGVTKIVTAEVSGIAPALTTAMAYDVPVVFARKKRPITMADGVYESSAPSHTKGGITPLIISPEYLLPTDKVLLIDDFLASGRTIKALIDVINQCGATLLGIGGVIEKSFEGGRDLLSDMNVPIVSLATISGMEGNSIQVHD